VIVIRQGLLSDPTTQEEGCMCIGSSFAGIEALLYAMTLKCDVRKLFSLECISDCSKRPGLQSCTTSYSGDGSTCCSYWYNDKCARNCPAPHYTANTQKKCSATSE
jgi:hypothetical protein